MNETPIEPEGLDDPALLAEIEAEFAELTAEIQRISAMPNNVGPRKSELLQALRASWRERLAARAETDRPEWRQKLDETIGHAVDRLLEDGIVENADGSLGFALRGDTIQNEGGPLLRGLLDGLAHMLSERFPQTPSPAQAQANPLNALLGGLGQALAGALKGAVSQVGAAAKSAGQSTSGGDVKVVLKPPEKAPEVVGTEQPVDLGSVDFRTEQQVGVSFEVDTRKDQKDGATPAESGPNVFFQQLFAGLGQAMRQALTPPTAPAAPTSPSQPAPAADPATQAAAGPGAPPTSDAPPPGPAPSAAPPSPFSGLGQLFLSAIQNAFTPPAANPAPANPAPSSPAPEQPPARVPPESAASSEAATPPTPEGAAPTATDPELPPMEVQIPQVGVTSTEGQPAPTLNVDIAGLLKQLLGNIKPPGT